MLPTKTLISKIEHLSKGLTPEQLTGFLDILDAMAIMVEEARELPPEKHNPTTHCLTSKSIH
jgi:Asp-tRNA(Asn)/Glu-tRNA(Gln) amidotransferase C subunit